MVEIATNIPYLVELLKLHEEGRFGRLKEEGYIWFLK